MSIADLRVGIGLLAVLRGAAVREGRANILPAIDALQVAALSDLRAARRLEALPDARREDYAPTECMVPQTRLADGGFAETLCATQTGGLPG